MSLPARPLVLCLSGHDPGGGAGIQADIEAIAAQDAHAMCVITALTVQDTCNALRVEPIAPELFAAQIELLMADSPLAAIKIGLIGCVEQIPVIVDTIARARVPVVCDPVLRAGGGSNLSSEPLMEAMRRDLLPRVDVITPNAAEARRLVPEAADLPAAAAALQRAGTPHVLITGGDEPTTEAINLWHRPDGAPQAFRWPRWPQAFHGSGCTLAAALAGRLALGEDMGTALEAAQRYTHGALGRGFASGRGRLLPERLSRRAAAQGLS